MARVSGGWVFEGRKRGIGMGGEGGAVADLMVFISLDEFLSAAGEQGKNTSL